MPFPGNFAAATTFKRGGRQLGRVLGNCPLGERDMETDMKTFRVMLGAAIAVAGLVSASAANAAPHGVRVGDLTCNVASGWGFVFGSSKDLHCTYRGSNGHREHYAGSISKFGVDI